MSQAYIGEVRLVGFNFAPLNWAQCVGQSVTIASNSTLFDLIGTTYGGNGTTTFNLPDLQGRIPLHQGSNGVTNYAMGQKGGLETVTLSLPQYPAHNHVFSASSGAGASGSPAGNAAGSASNVYSAAAPSAGMNAASLTQAPGNGQPHENRQPYQVINWVICLYGLFPSPN